jgi:hypothetical protein
VQSFVVFVPLATFIFSIIRSRLRRKKDKAAAAAAAAAASQITGSGPLFQHKSIPGGGEDPLNSFSSPPASASVHGREIGPQSIEMTIPPQVRASFAAHASALPPSNSVGAAGAGTSSAPGSGVMPSRKLTRTPSPPLLSGGGDAVQQNLRLLPAMHLAKSDTQESLQVEDLENSFKAHQLSHVLGKLMDQPVHGHGHGLSQQPLPGQRVPMSPAFDPSQGSPGEAAFGGVPIGAGAGAAGPALLATGPRPLPLAAQAPAVPAVPAVPAGPPAVPQWQAGGAAGAPAVPAVPSVPSLAQIG